jgi:leucyl/phenylalanyl-tRNA--protein transferase
MFAHESDASKAAFVVLMHQLRDWDIGLIDCQVHTDHLERFGAKPWPRERYLAQLAEAVREPTRRGRWTATPSPSASES